MRRTDAVARLESLLPELRERFGVRSMTLFGSTARDEAHDGSDVDVVVDLGPAPRYDTLFDVFEILGRELGCTVDILTPGAIRPRLDACIRREGVRVA